MGPYLGSYDKIIEIETTLFSPTEENKVTLFCHTLLICLDMSIFGQKLSFLVIFQKGGHISICMAKTSKLIPFSVLQCLNLKKK